MTAPLPSKRPRRQRFSRGLFRSASQVSKRILYNRLRNSVLVETRVAKAFEDETNCGEREWKTEMIRYFSIDMAEFEEMRKDARIFNLTFNQWIN